MKRITVLFMLLFAITFVYAQQFDISGIVVDKSLNEPIIGASAQIKGTNNGAITDLNGKFTIKNAKKGDVLLVTYVGYQPQILTLDGSKKSFTITMEEDTKSLDEVVVVGFGTQKKVNLTGAVATVDLKELESRPVTSVAQALQGTVPGLNISMPDTGGKLDGNPSINIRGTGNLGTGSSAAPLILIDGVAGDINTLNPQDIANISVLKDASSAAVYGSRAPFGVILITTKSGEKGKTSVQYSNNLRWSRPTNIPDMLDAYTFAQYFNRAIDNSETGKPHIFSDITMERIQQYMRGEITTTADPSLTQAGSLFAFNINSNDNQNWPRNYYDKTAFGHEHNLSVSGGNDKVRYYVSGAFLHQDGQMNFANDSKERFNVSSRVTADVTKWLTFEVNSRFIRQTVEMPTYLKLMGDNFFFGITKLHANMPLYDNNGHYVRNPMLAQITSGGRSKDTNDTYYTQGSAILRPVKGLTIQGDVAFRTGSNQNTYNIAKIYLYDKQNNPVPEPWQGGTEMVAGYSAVRNQAIQSSLFTSAVHADYEYSINNQHNFKLMVGMNAEKYTQNNLWGQRTNVIDDNIPSLHTSIGVSSNDQTIGEWATLGYFARLNYDFMGRYLFEFNIRKDGTSRFRGDTRWGSFPSLSVGWNIARESFWKPLEKYVNTLKPRFSYGSLGNQNTDAYYPTYSTQGVTAGSPDSGGLWLLTTTNKSNIASSPGLISSLLTWERITSYNYGIDFGAFNNRLTGYAEYFVRNTDDMVGPAQEISAIVGAGAPNRNNTSLQTKGWELQVNWQDRIGKVNYSIGFNVADSKSIVTKYPNNNKTLTDSQGNTLYYNGKELGEIWGYVTEGMAKTDEEMNAHLAKVDQSQLAQGTKIWRAGDIMYKDLDGNNKITNGENTADNPGDRKVIGNSTPRYRFGLSLSADYKGFDISAFFQGVGKRDLWLGGVQFWGVNGNEWNSTAYTTHWDFFRPEGDPLGANTNAYFPRPIYDNNQNHHAQTRYLQNGAYIRLKNLQIGYTFPKQWMAKIGLQKIRVFFSGDNLWTGSNIKGTFDPEATFNTGQTYLLSRTVSCGVNIVL